MRVRGEREVEGREPGYHVRDPCCSLIHGHGHGLEVVNAYADVWVESVSGHDHAQASVHVFSDHWCLALLGAGSVACYVAETEAVLGYGEEGHDHGL